MMPAEMCAERLGIGRGEQDAHAIASVERARRAMAEGAVEWEVVPVEVPTRGGGARTVREVSVRGRWEFGTITEGLGAVTEFVSFPSRGLRRQSCPAAPVLGGTCRLRECG
jgi:acetyl-CoA acetyltransferase